MLKLTRRINESLIISDIIGIKIYAIHGRQVQLGIHAPSNIDIHRLEVFKIIHEQKQKDSGVITFDYPPIIEIMEKIHHVR